MDLSETFHAIYGRIAELFSPTMWCYLLAPSDNPDYCGRLSRVICRYRGHPAGVVYFNPGRYEPDMTCKHCGDDLG